MLDRQKIETILRRRFPGAARDQMAAAANAIMGLGEDWEEVAVDEGSLSHDVAARCQDDCLLAREASRGGDFRLLRRRGV